MEDNMIKIIGAKNCGKCKMAESILKSKNVDFEYFDCESDFGKEVIEDSEMRSLPIIIIEDNYFCDSEALKKCREIIE